MPVGVANCLPGVLDSWEQNWIHSKKEGKEYGKFVRTAGKFFHNEEDKGECHVC